MTKVASSVPSIPCVRACDLDENRGSRSERFGTGFVIAPGRVLTALHIIEPKYQSCTIESLLKARRRLLLQFKATAGESFIEVSAEIERRFFTANNASEDWVVLQYAHEAVAGAIPLSPGTLPSQYERTHWDSYGYIDKTEGMAVDGELLPSFVQGSATRWQVRCNQTAASQSNSLRGLSGGPCLVQGKVIAIFTEELQAGGHSSTNRLNTAYVLPLSIVAERHPDLWPDWNNRPVNALDATEDAYRQRVINQFARLRVRGSGQTPVELPLDELYVDLNTVIEIPDELDAYGPDERRFLRMAERGELPTADSRVYLDTLRLDRWRQDARTGAISRARKPIFSLLKDALVVLGDPGSGKTTLLHYLTLCAARGVDQPHRDVPDDLLRTPSGHVLPIFVPLAAYHDHLREQQASCTLGEFLTRYHERHHSLQGLGPVFDRALQQGRCLILLDGLDEVVDATQRNSVTNQISLLIQREIDRGNRILVSSRVIGYREEPLSGDLRVVTVLDLGPREVSLFARRWCRAYEVAIAGNASECVQQHANEEAAGLLQDIRSQPNLTLLAANPLLLSMLASLRYQDRGLLKKRVDLYDHYVCSLLKTWPITRSTGARRHAIDRIDEPLVISHLTELAQWFHCNVRGGTVRSSELKGAVVSICLRYNEGTSVKYSTKSRVEAEREADRFLTELRERHGLLAERGPDAWGFLHRTFQEYFFGRALALMDASARWSHLAPCLHSPKWREPLLFCAGRLATVAGTSSDASELVDRILNAGSDHEEILHRDLFLACDVAAEDLGLPVSQLDDLYARLQPLENDRLEGIRLAAIRHLAALARVGHEPSIQHLLSALERPGERAERSRVFGVLSPLWSVPCCSKIKAALLRLLDHPEHSELVVSTLIPLAEWDPSVREILLRRLEMGREDPSILFFLSLGAKDDAELKARLANAWLSRPVQQSTISFAIDYCMDLPEVRKRIASSIESPDTNVRTAALSAFARLAAVDSDAWGLVKEQLQTIGAHERSAVLAALGPQAAFHPGIREVVKASLADPQTSVQCAAIHACSTWLSDDAELERRILNLVKVDNDRLVQAALSTLAPLAGRRKEIRKLFLDRGRDPHSQIRSVARGTLASLATADPDVRLLLSDLLASPTLAPRAGLVDTVAPLARHDLETEEKLWLLLRDKEHSVRVAAIRGLAPLLSPNSPRLIEYAQLIEDESEPYIQKTAIQELGALAGTVDSLKHRLLTKLQPDEARIGQTIAGLLAPMIPVDKDVRAAFLKVQGGLSSRMVRLDALEIIAFGAPYDATIQQTIRKLTTDSELGFDALKALAPLASQEPALCSMLLTKARSPHPPARTPTSLLKYLVSQDDVISILIERLEEDVNPPSLWWNEFSALAPLVRTNPVVRSALVRYITKHQSRAMKFNLFWRKEEGFVLEALTYLTANHQGLTLLMEEMLNDPNPGVRAVSAIALCPLLQTDAVLARRFRPWLGAVGSEAFEDPASFVRCRLADSYAPLIEQDPSLRDWLCDGLDSPSRHLRQGAAWTLIAIPGGPSRELLPKLRRLLEDRRSIDGTDERLQIARLLLNCRDHSLVERAITTVQDILRYKREEWHIDSGIQESRRSQAAHALGTLVPLDPSPELSGQFLALLEDKDPSVRSAAYQGLLRLLATEAGLILPN